MKDNDEFRQTIARSSLNKSFNIQAGPGSGKTSLLIDRLKYIIENRGKTFSGIACITYTNAAKDEIVMRLNRENIQLPRELFIGTIHSFLLEFIIKPYSHIYNKGVPFKVASPGYARGKKQVISNLLTREAFLIRESTFKAFESLGRNERGIPTCYSDKIPAEVAKKWKDTLKQEGYIDQQDIIYLSAVILHNNDHIRKAFSARFPYVLVDEYQDVTVHQERIFSMMENSFFFCVGDQNQSVYSFTGANPGIFNSKFNADSHNSYVLSNNYRSSSYIVNFTNKKSSMSQIETGPNKDYHQKVILFNDITECEEAISLFQVIVSRTFCEELHKPYMILARDNNYANVLQKMMGNQEGEFDEFLKKLKTKNYRSYSILNNFLLAIMYERKNQAELAFEKLEEAFSYLFYNEHPSFVSLSDIGYDRFMWKKLQIFTFYHLKSFDFEATSVAEFYLKIKEFISEASKRLYGKSVGKKLRMLNYNWKDQVRLSKITMLSQLIQQVELQNNLFQDENDVFTIHGAKGREAECVLVVAETEKQLQEWFEKNDQSEEARVGYVAFSRARKVLCIWAPSLQKKNYDHLLEEVEFINN